MSATIAAPGTPIRWALLALLAQRPGHGYDLKQRFERSVGGVWPLNIGQVYDALRRLERDGLIEPHGSDDPERRPFAATAAGASAASQWLAQSADRPAPPRDELAIRVLVAQATGLADVGALVQHEREEAMRRLQVLARRKLDAIQRADLAETSLLDLLMLRAEADSRWLDLVELRTSRSGAV